MCGKRHCDCAENSDYLGKNVGTPVILFPGYVDNDARYSPQTDINPVPVVPVHFQQWPGMQVQLLNGWELTNYGKIITEVPFGAYNQKAGGSSATFRKSSPPLPGQGQQPQGNMPPSQIQLANSMMNGANQQGLGATASMSDNVMAAVASRRYYG